ncbi:unnamed protein product [Linum trigynum]|uniref:Uncharacterized protein n=1 Tax=Linum trigynum TaxID=586398 RepID=A0AAV2GQJ8_9ROSI
MSRVLEQSTLEERRPERSNRGAERSGVEEQQRPERSNGAPERSSGAYQVGGAEQSRERGVLPCRRSLVMGSAVPGRRSPEEKWRRGGAPDRTKEEEENWRTAKKKRTRRLCFV